MNQANCIADLRTALAEQMANEQVEPIKIGDALLGYVWMRFEREELQLFDCLNYAVSLAEEHPAPIESKAIYKLLLKLTFDDHKKIIIKGSNLFRNCKILAIEQWLQLNSQGADR